MASTSFETVTESPFPPVELIPRSEHHAEAERTVDRMLANRGNNQWALAFALRYFGFPAEALRYIVGIPGQNRLNLLWEMSGAALYDSPWYTLRQEWFHTGMSQGWGRPLPEFFQRLPPDATLLDWGSGTAEMQRLDWIEGGGKTILMDCPGPNFDYVRAKYPLSNVTCLDVTEPVPVRYDALICTHVFEHIERPIEALHMLWKGLKPGGYALLWFDTSYPAPGHLPSAIAREPEYYTFLTQQAIPIQIGPYYEWVRKPIGGLQAPWACSNSLEKRQRLHPQS